VRLSRDKVNVLARAVADALKQIDEVDFIEDPNTIRQETRKILEELLNHEERGSTRPPARRLKARSAPSSKARRSGTSSTASITTRK
jgi:hypothetical protein